MAKKKQAEEPIVEQDEQQPEEQAQVQLEQAEQTEYVESPEVVSMKGYTMTVNVDPDEVRAPAYAVQEFRDYVQKYLEESGSKPNVLTINSLTLDKLGYKDVAIELGLAIKGGGSFDEDKMVLSLEI